MLYKHYWWYLLCNCGKLGWDSSCISELDYTENCRRRMNVEVSWITCGLPWKRRLMAVSDWTRWTAVDCCVRQKNWQNRILSFAVIKNSISSGNVIATASAAACYRNVWMSKNIICLCQVFISYFFVSFLSNCIPLLVFL